MAHVSTSAREEIGADLVIIGAGIVGAMCAHYAIASGLRTILIDRNSVASGTTGAGEGNIMVSDKSPGPELDLALISRELLFEVGARVGDSFELVALAYVNVSYEQNAQQALQRADRAYVLEIGKITKEAKAKDLLNDSHVKSAYLGTGANEIY